jgi:hypothetical protein
MTHPHSPLPWTVRQEGAIFDADGVPVISDDGALYPEDRDLIVTAVNNYEKMRKALEEAISFQNDDTDCLACRAQNSFDEEEREGCPDRRCHDHGCMVARVNRWRAALAGE